MPPLAQVGAPVVDVVVLPVVVVDVVGGSVTVVVVVLVVVVGARVVVGGGAVVVVVVRGLPRVTDISSNQAVGLPPCAAETSTPVGVPPSSI